MIVFLHVVMALMSMATISGAFLRANQSLLTASYVLFGGTVASGAYLIWIGPHNMIQACTSGLAYMAVVATGIVLTRRKLSAVRTNA